MALAVFEKGRKVGRIEKTILEPRDLLEIIGRVLVSDSQKAFTAQRYGGASWPERMVPNWPGIVEDARAGRNPPSRRLDPRPALMDTGTLFRSIAYRITGAKSVEAGSTLPYAGKLQKGGTSQPDAWSSRARKVFGKWWRAQDEDVRKATAWLWAKKWLSEPFPEIEHPERPFVGMTPEAMKKIRVLIQRAVANA